jgi:hypothetical protein
VSQKGKHTSAKTPLTHGPDGPGRVASARERGGASGPAGPKAEWAVRLAGPKTKKNNF